MCPVNAVSKLANADASSKRNDLIHDCVNVEKLGLDLRIGQPMSLIVPDKLSDR